MHYSFVKEDLEKMSAALISNQIFFNTIFVKAFSVDGVYE